jgi:hypothetical protein
MNTYSTTQAPSVMYGTWSVDIDGTPMTAVPVTGDVKF